MYAYYFEGADEDNLSKLLQSIGDEEQRLHFITTLSSAKSAIDGAKTDLNNIKSQVGSCLFDVHFER